MSGSFQMPRNPADFRPPSLRAEDGTNLFGDPDAPAQAAASADDNVFRPPTPSDEGPVYKVTGYETTLPHRGGLIFTLGWLGVGAPFVGLGLLALYYWRFGFGDTIPMTPLLILSLVFSLPAWILSSIDAKALDAGAMQPEGRRKTVLGGWLGVLGTFLALFLGLPALVVAIYWAILSIMQVV